MTGSAFARVDDLLNPIVVKELRQAFRGRFIPALITLLLGVLLIALGTFLASADIQQSSGRGADAAIGSGAFFTILGLVLLACTVFVPLAVALRMHSERNGMDFALIASTSLTPGALVRGKLFSGIVMALLLYSIATPFLTFTYLLRGIDVPTIVLSVAGSFLLVLPILQVSILVASLPGPRALTGLALAATAFGGLMAIPMISTLLGVAAVSVGTSVLEREFWFSAGSAVVAEACVVAVLFSFNAAVLAPPFSNRARPVRITLTIAWAVIGFESILWEVLSTSPGGLLPWYYVSLLAAAISMLASASAQDSLSPRVAREVPARPLPRAAAFFLFSLSGGGLAWATLIGVSTLLVIAGGHTSGLFYVKHLEEHLQAGGVILVEGLTYALLGFLLTRGPLHRRVPARHAWILGLSLVGLVSSVSAVFEMLVQAAVIPAPSLPFWRIANPFILGDEVSRLTCLLGTLPILVLLLLLAAPRLEAQVRSFRPPAAR
ncbi:MAG: hypothetical protein U0166_06270 [Acidobacteriota bacterium]